MFVHTYFILELATTPHFVYRECIIVLPLMLFRSNNCHKCCSDPIISDPIFLPVAGVPVRVLKLLFYCTSSPKKKLVLSYFIDVQWYNTFFVHTSALEVSQCIKFASTKKSLNTHHNF